MSNTTRIAKNTLMLYFRQILIMLVSLYTVRVVMETLGVENYGIYNVAAGVVTMFGFLSASMANSSLRYFSFELGRGDYEQLKGLFNLNLMIYILIAVLVLVLAESIGVWFVSNKLVIPLERKDAALGVYQASIISFLFTILTAPYMAAIIAHEDMNIYAYVSIVEVLLKLAVIFLLRLFLMDKLFLYGILMCIVTVINTAIYRTICIVKYQECKFKFYWHKGLFIETISYTIWNLISVLADIGKKQAVTILLNQFFNPIVAAARTISFSGTNAAAAFLYQFSTATRPQIIKNYAAGEYKKMLSLVFFSTRCNFFLMYLFVLPLFLEMKMVLFLWLKNPPELTVLFTRLMLIDVLVDVINFPICTAAQATGKIKLFQFVSAVIFISNFPLSLLALFFGAPAYSVFVIAICITAIAYILRLIVLKRLIDISISKLIKDVIIPIFICTVLSMVLPIIIHGIMDYGLFRLFSVVFVSIISICTCMYFIGLDKKERNTVKTILMKKIHSVFAVNKNIRNM
jgi:O-antigen/teichoic acid export membrane protein